MSDERPDPDALLRRVEAQERRRRRGRLTVFLGAAPGVGKTFAMLAEAGYLRDVEDRDVVAGVVETHGRFETATMLASFELLPKRRVEYRGTTLEELDLDAALARKPSLLLVDELAHTNAEGSRHPKRWQDVEELRDAGIEVMTTLNIQHLESLNDVVAQITGVVVRETVPDSVLDGADELKLVDLPPDELIERLREGKVYVAAQAERALESFFRKGNLIALRELSLRKTAERVDEDMRQWRRAHGVEKTWAASDRLLVCISPSPFSASLLRVARRMAQGLRAHWYAVHVETPGARALSTADRARLSEHLRLAEELGARTATLTGPRAAEEILRFAREENVTKIVVGKPRDLGLRERVLGGFVDHLIHGSRDIDVYVTVGEVEDAAPRRAPRAPAEPSPTVAIAYLPVATTAAVATVVAALAFGRDDLADVVMTYLLGVVLVSMRFGSRTSLATAVLCVLAFDFFFIPPFFTFSVSDVRHVGTFAVMLFVASVIAGLTQRVKDQVDVARRSERRTARLYAMSRELSRAETREAVVSAACHHVEEAFDARTVVFRPSASGPPEPMYTTPGLAPLSDKELGIVRWVSSNRQEAGTGTHTVPGAAGLYVPLTSASVHAGAGGVLGVFPADAARFADPEQRHLAATLAAQLGSALERVELAEETQRARLEVEAERLRSTLLSSVSHDLRTPLAVMKGVASTLVDDDASLPAGTRRELAVTLQEETDRLERLVRNLLDMTRIESGAMRVQKEWQSIEEAVGGALSRVEARLSGREVTTHVPPELYAPFDGILIEQVLVNLLENCAKHTAPGVTIDVSARRQGDAVTVTVADRGPGLAEGDEARVFEKFYRGAGAEGGASRERAPTGVGLGLAICRAIVVAHGGDVGAANRPGGGAQFHFSLPLDGEAPEGALPELQDDEVGGGP